jgi:choline dehydrogenase-like flavoprotein
MSLIADPIKAGLARGWAVFGGPYAAAAPAVQCDVAIIGTGAGAGISADLLSAAGLKVVMIEEGPLRSSSDFRQVEAEAYPALYQESANRKTADKAVSILQGRCVGGSTTVNWTSSFRTPEATLHFWRERFALPEMTPQAMAPWFEQAERRLGIGPWDLPPNANNQCLQRGAARLGISTSPIPRNVRGCWNLGSCGMGCPTNAKQSMLVTTVPAALDRGATLLVQTRAQRLNFVDGRAASVTCVPLEVNGAPGKAAPVQVVARHFVVAGGAINSPALLLRSGTPDPHRLLGRRTFLHPVVLSTAAFDEAIEGWRGAPMTFYTDHFLNLGPIDGPMGYKVHTPPLHPLISSIVMPGFGPPLAQGLADFPRTHALLALLRDGFSPQSTGGSVALRGDGTPVLDYPLGDFVFDGARRALLSMAELQFAAGARKVTPAHERAGAYTSWAQARDAIAALPMAPLLARVMSAHVMGGCPMAGSAQQGVVRPDGVHWQVENVSVHDGSLFPTSIGANPQLSVYGLVNKLATQLARRLGGHAVTLA